MYKIKTIENYLKVFRETSTSLSLNLHPYFIVLHVFFILFLWQEDMLETKGQL